jgi:hypothetical protein
MLPSWAALVAERDLEAADVLEDAGLGRVLPLRGESEGGFLVNRYEEPDIPRRAVQRSHPIF